MYFMLLTIDIIHLDVDITIQVWIEVIIHITSPGTIHITASWAQPPQSPFSHPSDFYQIWLLSSGNFFWLPRKTNHRCFWSTAQSRLIFICAMISGNPALRAATPSLNDRGLLWSPSLPPPRQNSRPPPILVATPRPPTPSQHPCPPCNKFLEPPSPSYSSQSITFISFIDLHRLPKQQHPTVLFWRRIYQTWSI